MAKAPRQVARARENMENTISELHTGPWHTELLKECTQGSLVPLAVPLVQSGKDLNKLQQYLSGHWMVKDAKLEFHASIKLRRVYKTIFFSDQGGSWHCLQYICRVASVARPRKSKSGTVLLQLQQVWSCAWKGVHAKQIYHWYRTRKLCHWPWNVKSTIRKAEHPRHSRLGSPWAWA